MRAKRRGASSLERLRRLKRWKSFAENPSDRLSDLAARLDCMAQLKIASEHSNTASDVDNS